MRKSRAGFRTVGERTLCGLRQYFAVGRIDLPLERKNRVGKRNARLIQSQRGPASSVSGQAAIASSLRCSGDNFCSSHGRSAGIPPVGCRELRLGALTFLAREVNRDANRVRDCCHGNDFHRETQRAWNVDDRVNSEENSGSETSGTANRQLRATRLERATECAAPKIGIANIVK